MSGLDWSAHRLVLAPMAGGPSTVALAAAGAEAGMFPFLAGAYLTADRLRTEVAALRSQTSAPFGVNLFVPSPNGPSMLDDSRTYAAVLAPWAEAAGVSLGEPRYDDDGFDVKVRALVELAPPVVSFSFGWPPADVVAALQAVGCEVWVTVNAPDEVVQATSLGVDGLVAQGWEAGGHRGGPSDAGVQQLAVRELVSAMRLATDLPVMVAGGVMSGGEAAALLGLGATAVAFGTAFLCCPEAGTAQVHRDALTQRERTTVTRAFTGRSARALVTTWTERFGSLAPAAYPHVHHLTAPLRAHGKATGNAELVHLWAGTGHARIRALPAAELGRRLMAELMAALETS
jgi:nitronate monooxygenase